jgi:pyrroloquinoline quinone biosynthesis protein B
VSERGAPFFCLGCVPVFFSFFKGSAGRMELIVLGSGAGGGVPQWNCGCPNCTRAREVPEEERTQSSLAASWVGRRWLLCNASPDLRTQFARTRELAPREGAIRASPIAAVALTDAQIDHVTGLLTLRESEELSLVCTPQVEEILREELPLLPVLENYLSLRVLHYPATVAGISMEALDLGGSPPPFAPQRSTEGQVVALRLTTREGKRVVYAPGLPCLSPAFDEFVLGSDCLFLDGTFFRDEELSILKIKARRAKEMGHLPIGDPDGTLAWVRKLQVPRKVYVHINNTNPILDPTSRERQTVREAGIEIGRDGMKIVL